MSKEKCKFCGAKLNDIFIDLGMHPLCNSNIHSTDLDKPEKIFPLIAFICSSCFLVQVIHSIKPEEIFSDYNYLSSYSKSWLKHAADYCKKVKNKFGLNGESFIVEIASNDGYLLKNFINDKIPCIGIEPAKNVAEVSERNGIKTINSFFSYELSNEIIRNYKKADLIIANNVLAHVPNINDFIKGAKNLLSNNGVFTIEFPYLKNLIEFNQFDTIYHEHFFYYSIITLKQILKFHGLKIFDIEKLNTHGGSLRVYATHSENYNFTKSKILGTLINKELELGFNTIDFYGGFERKAQKIKYNLLMTLLKIKKEGKSIIGYGAPGKGNTLLNYCGIKNDIIDFTVDKNPIKQNTYLPGSRIPVYDMSKIKEHKPDFILILPWNIKNEIIDDIGFIRKWNGKFIIPIPEVKII